jgi:hypothetical protein
MGLSFQKACSSLVVFIAIFFVWPANSMRRAPGGMINLRKTSCGLPSVLTLRGGGEGPEPPGLDEKEEVADEELAQIQENVLKMWDIGMKETERFKRDGVADLKETRGKVSEISEQEAEKILLQEQEERERAANEAAAAIEAEKQAITASQQKEEPKVEEQLISSHATPLSAADYVADTSQPPALPVSPSAGPGQVEEDSKSEAPDEGQHEQKEEMQHAINLNDLRRQVEEVHVYHVHACVCCMYMHMQRYVFMLVVCSHIFMHAEIHFVHVHICECALSHTVCLCACSPR